MASGEITMKFHRFNQFVILPLSLIGYVYEVFWMIRNTEQLFYAYGAEISISYAILISITALLNVITQIGFIRMHGFSYYSFLAIRILNIANSFFMFSYIYNEEAIYNRLYASLRSNPSFSLFRDAKTLADLTNYYRNCLGLGIVFGLGLSVVFILYYAKRKQLFRFSKSDNGIKRKKDPWRNTERYVPDRGMKISKEEEITIAARRLQRLSEEKSPEDEDGQDNSDSPE